LQDAIREAAKRAKLDPATVHAEYLEKEPGLAAQLAASFGQNDDDDAAGGDVFARIAAERRGLLAQALGDVKRLASAGSVQARCLECGGLGPSDTAKADARLLDLILARVGL
jgi:protease-4